MKLLVAYTNFATSPLKKVTHMPTMYLVPVSRLQQKSGEYLPCHNDFPMPEFSPRTVNSGYESFVEAMFSSARWAIQQSEILNIPLGLMWSGGLDSTAVYFALKHIGAKFDVYLSTNSIHENPELFNDHICSEKLYSSRDYNKFRHYLVTGDLGDQIFGSDIYQTICDNLGHDRIYHPDYEAVFFDHYASVNCDRASAQWMFDKYVATLGEFPSTIQHIGEFMWWIAITHKWQSIRYRYMMHVESHQRPLIKTHFHPLFGHTDLEKWSLETPFHFKMDGDVTTWKNCIRRFISEFGNSKYILTRKINSQANILWGSRRVPGVYSDYSECYSINEQLNLL
jgi:hypothetical protein